MPVAHFGIAADEPLRLGEFALRPVQIAASSRIVAKLHMYERAADGRQATNLGQRLGRIVNPKIENRIVPRPAGALRLDNQDSRRLPPANVAAFALGRVERGEESIDQFATGAAVSSAIAGHTDFLSMMLACTENPSPTICPASGIVVEPV